MKRVLVIDDSPTIRFLVKVYLTGLDVSVDEAHDGESGLKALRAGAVDLVIADLRMPGMDGFELVRRVRGGALSPNVPILLLTMETAAGLREEALRVGASEFISKPVPHKVLREAVSRWLGTEPPASQA